MKISATDLWRWDGTIDRGPYAVIGFVGFAVKHNLDRILATLVFHRPWSLFNYWIPPTGAVRIYSLPRPDAIFLGTMLSMALPFIWIGVALSLRRLRSVGLPTWLVLVFFLPLVNLIFFALLSVLPSSPGRTPGRPLAGDPSRAFLARLMPESPLGSAAMAVLLTAVFGAGITALSTRWFSQYGWGLFVALPFVLGLGSVLLYGYHGPRGFGSCLAVSLLSIVLLGLGLVGVAVEGIVCLVMAAPLAVVLAALGGSVGFAIQRRPETMHTAPSMMLVLMVFIPTLMQAESLNEPEPPLFAVTTTVEIEAPPEAVWKQVVSFSDLPPPDELIFRLGIAYPTRATINGRGTGAIRRCQFSTGAFIEPIEIWDEPRRLRFSVAANPPPLREWTPYAQVHAPHLAGFLVSRQGEFLLTPLSGGRTLLTGTTWYQHHMWPAGYWQLWSDAMIHRIHRRVLMQIQRLAESGVASCEAK